MHTNTIEKRKFVNKRWIFFNVLITILVLTIFITIFTLQVQPHTDPPDNSANLSIPLSGATATAESTQTSEANASATQTTTSTPSSSTTATTAAAHTTATTSTNQQITQVEPNSASTGNALYQRIQSTAPLYAYGAIPINPLGFQEKNSTYSTCGVVNGQYEISVITQKWAETCSAMNTNYPDFAMQVTGTYVSDFSYRGWGISFRRLNNYQMCLRIGNDGYFRVIEETIHGTSTRLLYDQSPTINNGYNQSNTLTVIGMGKNIWFYINGLYIGYYEQQSTAFGGQLGMTVTSTDNSPISVRFTNLKIWNLQGQTL